MVSGLEGIHEEISREAVPQPVQGFELTETACCWLLRDTESEKTIKLNDSSLLIWQLCDGQQSVGEIIALLVAQYPGVDSIPKDINRAIGELAEEGVITVA